MDKDTFHLELDKWLSEIIANENPANAIAAYRIGLGEVEEGYVLYLAGSENYDEADDEWAAYPPDFVAGNELVISDENEQEWYWLLLNVIYSLGKTLRKDPAKHSFLGGSTPVYTGFESGDLYRIK